MIGGVRLIQMEKLLKLKGQLLRVRQDNPLKVDKAKVARLISVSHEKSNS